MLPPPLPDVPVAIATIQHTACDLVERERVVDEGFSIPSRPPLAEKISKARVRCTWKDCHHREADTDEMK